MRFLIIALFPVSCLSQTMFFHLDKSVYVPNENIWFTGYLLNSPSVMKHTTLYARLVKADTKEIVAKDRFYMSSGIATGSIMIRDSTVPGVYQLMFYTNMNLSDTMAPYYTRTVEIKTNKQLGSGLLNTRLQRDSTNIVVTTDSVSYGNRGKVTVHIKAGTMAVYSFSCALLARSPEVSTILQPGPGLYRTTAPVNAPETWALHYNGKPVRSPTELKIFTGSLESVIIPKNGTVDRQSEAIVMPFGKAADVFLFETKDLKNYELVIRDNLKEKDVAYASALSVPERNKLVMAEDSVPMVNTLKAVYVKARRTDWYTSPAAERLNGRNPCGDWVCQYNILNCPNHPYGTDPVKGEVYRDVTLNREVKYMGCSKVASNWLCSVKGNSEARPYIAADYSKNNPPDPEINTTLMWSYLTSTDERGEATIEFYTNDLTGRFICTVNGISADGPIHGISTFTVKRPKP